MDDTVKSFKGLILRATFLVCDLLYMLSRKAGMGEYSGQEIRSVLDERFPS